MPARKGDLLKLTWFNLYKKSRVNRILFPIVGVILFFDLAGIVYMSLAGIVDENTLFVGLLALLLPASFYVSLRLSIGRTYKKSAHLYNTPRKYTFSQDKVHIELDGSDTKSSEDDSYGAFVKVYETQEAFYLYITNQLAHILPKRCMEQRTVEDLHALLAEKLSDRFIGR